MNHPPILKRLHTDHARTSQVLRVLEQQMDRFSSSDGAPDFGLLRELVEYVVEYPDAIHHPLEDRLFGYLLGKGATPAEERLVLSNLDQHVEIKAGTRKLLTDIRAILNGSVMPADQLRMDVAAYVDLQRAHMLIEEGQLFPLATRLLSADDWARLETELGAIQDPMFDQAAARFANLYRYILELHRATDG